MVPGVRTLIGFWDRTASQYLSWRLESGLARPILVIQTRASTSSFELECECEYESGCEGVMVYRIQRSAESTVKHRDKELGVREYSKIKRGPSLPARSAEHVGVARHRIDRGKGLASYGPGHRILWSRNRPRLCLDGHHQGIWTKSASLNTKGGWSPRN